MSSWLAIGREPMRSGRRSGNATVVRAEWRLLRYTSTGTAPDSSRGGVLRARVLVDDRLQRPHHRARVGVLDDVAAVDDPGGARAHQRVRALEHLVVR